MRPIALMFPDGNFLAHVSRLLEIAKVLRSKHDWDVRFAGSGRYIELARQAGFPCRDCFTVEKEDTLMLARRAAWVGPILVVARRGAVDSFRRRSDPIGETRRGGG